jgi:hypothetical protein
MDLRSKIMARLKDIGIAERTADIAQAISEDAMEVQVALIELDDDGMVIMRNGWYLASAKGMLE